MLFLDRTVNTDMAICGFYYITFLVYIILMLYNSIHSSKIFKKCRIILDKPIGVLYPLLYGGNKCVYCFLV